MERYIEITYVIPIRLLIKNSGVLKYIKELFSKNFKFHFSEELDLTTGYTTLVLDDNINIDVFERHFNIITLDILSKKEQ